MGGERGGEQTDCDPSYPDDCIPPPPPDLDCGDEGVPENFEVRSPDPHGFDDDNDGTGCETEPPDTTCPDGQVIEDGECVDPPPECEEDQVIEDGECVNTVEPPLCTEPPDNASMTCPE